MKYPFSDHIMIIARILGTTFTGHPTRTTLGNTLRMLFMTLYIAHLAGVDASEFLHWHAGDDVLVYAPYSVC